MFNSMANILAMGAPQGQQGGAGLIQMLVLFGAVILIMYFLMIRPQQKRQKEHQKMLDNLKRGDKVITTAGIHGTITDIDGSSMILQVSDNVKMTFEKTAIAAKK